MFRCARDRVRIPACGPTTEPSSTLRCYPPAVAGKEHHHSVGEKKVCATPVIAWRASSPSICVQWRVAASGSRSRSSSKAANGNSSKKHQVAMPNIVRPSPDQRRSWQARITFSGRQSDLLGPCSPPASASQASQLPPHVQEEQEAMGRRGRGEKLIHPNNVAIGLQTGCVRLLCALALDTHLLQLQINIGFGTAYSHIAAATASAPSSIIRSVSSSSTPHDQLTSTRKPLGLLTNHTVTQS